jgi:zinc protease
VISKLLWNTAYRVHPYRHPVIGYEDVFKTVTREDLLSFIRYHYVPDNMMVVVVGDVDGAEVEGYLRETLGAFERRSRAPVYIPEEPPQMAPRLAHQTGNFNVGRLRWAYHTTALSHPDTPALDLLAAVVGRGRSSRLVREVKERQRLAFEIGASSYTPKDPGIFSIYASFDPARQEEIVRAIQEEIDSWKTEPMRPQEIDKARRILLVDELRQLETVNGQASSYASGEFYAADPLYAERYLELLEKVTPEDLMAVARRYFAPENRTLVLLTPESEPAEATAAAAAQEVPGLQRMELSNGVPLIVREDHRLPFVHVCAVSRGGLLAENAENNGITKLMADLLVRGTPDRSAEEIAETVDGSPTASCVPPSPRRNSRNKGPCGWPRFRRSASSRSFLPSRP